MKIAILGYSGSGKSTLAQFLGAQYGVPVLHLDRLNWLPGWQMRDARQADRLAHDFLDAHDSWVIDGNYVGLAYARRLREADHIVLLDFCRTDCLMRAVRRYVRYRGRSRDSIAPGCREKLDWAFVCWIMRDGRSPLHRARSRAVLRRYGHKTAVLRTQRELTAYMRAVQQKNMKIGLKKPDICSKIKAVL